MANPNRSKFFDISSLPHWNTIPADLSHRENVPPIFALNYGDGIYHAMVNFNSSSSSLVCLNAGDFDIKTTKGDPDMFLLASHYRLKKVSDEVLGNLSSGYNLILAPRKRLFFDIENLLRQDDVSLMDQFTGNNDLKMNLRISHHMYDIRDVLSQQLPGFSWNDVSQNSNLLSLEHKLEIAYPKKEKNVWKSNGFNLTQDPSQVNLFEKQAGECVEHASRWLNALGDQIEHCGISGQRQIIYNGDNWGNSREDFLEYIQCEETLSEMRNIKVEKIHQKMLFLNVMNYLLRSCDLAFEDQEDWRREILLQYPDLISKTFKISLEMQELSNQNMKKEIMRCWESSHSGDPFDFLLLNNLDDENLIYSNSLTSFFDVALRSLLIKKDPSVSPWQNLLQRWEEIKTTSPDLEKYFKKIFLSSDLSKLLSEKSMPKITQDHVNLWLGFSLEASGVQIQENGKKRYLYQNAPVTVQIKEKIKESQYDSSYKDLTEKIKNDRFILDQKIEYLHSTSQTQMTEEEMIRFSEKGFVETILNPWMERGEWNVSSNLLKKIDARSAQDILSSSFVPQVFGEAFYRQVLRLAYKDVEKIFYSLKMIQELNKILSAIPTSDISPDEKEMFTRIVSFLAARLYFSEARQAILKANVADFFALLKENAWFSIIKEQHQNELVRDIAKKYMFSASSLLDVHNLLKEEYMEWKEIFYSHDFKNKNDDDIGSAHQNVLTRPLLPLPNFIHINLYTSHLNAWMLLPLANESLRACEILEQSGIKNHRLQKNTIETACRLSEQSVIDYPAYQRWHDGMLKAQAWSDAWAREVQHQRESYGHSGPEQVQKDITSWLEKKSLPAQEVVDLYQEKALIDKECEATAAPDISHPPHDVEVLYRLISKLTPRITIPPQLVERAKQLYIETDQHPQMWSESSDLSDQIKKTEVFFSYWGKLDEELEAIAKILSHPRYKSYFTTDHQQTMSNYLQNKDIMGARKLLLRVFFGDALSNVTLQQEEVVWDLVLNYYIHRQPIVEKINVKGREFIVPSIYVSSFNSTHRPEFFYQYAAQKLGINLSSLYRFNKAGVSISLAALKCLFEVMMEPLSDNLYQSHLKYKLFGETDMLSQEYQSLDNLDMFKKIYTVKEGALVLSDHGVMKKIALDAQECPSEMVSDKFVYIKNQNELSSFLYPYAYELYVPVLKACHKLNVLGADWVMATNILHAPQNWRDMLWENTMDKGQEASVPPDPQCFSYHVWQSCAQRYASDWKNFVSLHVIGNAGYLSKIRTTHKVYKDFALVSPQEMYEKHENQYTMSLMPWIDGHHTVQLSMALALDRSLEMIEFGQCYDAQSLKHEILDEINKDLTSAGSSLSPQKDVLSSVSSRKKKI